MRVIIIIGNIDTEITKKRVIRAVEEYNKIPSTVFSKITNKFEQTTLVLFSGMIYNKYNYTPIFNQDACLIENKSRNTMESLMNSKEYIDNLVQKTLQTPSLVVCTSSYSINRTIILSKLILHNYSLEFIHTREPITPSQYHSDIRLLTSYIDEYCKKCLSDPIIQSINSVTFIRHAESLFNNNGTRIKDVFLSKHGESQAKELYGTFDLVICSPLLRTRDTLRLSGIKYSEILYTDLCREHKDDNIINYYGNENLLTDKETEQDFVKRSALFRILLKEKLVTCPSICVISHASFLYQLLNVAFKNSQTLIVTNY